MRFSRGSLAWMLAIVAVAGLALAGCDKKNNEMTITQIEEPNRLPELPALDADKLPAGSYGSPVSTPTPTYGAVQPPARSTQTPAYPPVEAAPLPPAPVVRTHTAVRGDTYWSLAVKYYGDGQRWKDIRNANPLVPPDKIKIGTALVIPD